MTTESTSPHNAVSDAQTSGANARLALKLVALAVVIFLITLWKFRPV
jgi:hypothetical protein